MLDLQQWNILTARHSLKIRRPVKKQNVCGFVHLESHRLSVTRHDNLSAWFSSEAIKHIWVMWGKIWVLPPSDGKVKIISYSIPWSFHKPACISQLKLIGSQCGVSLSQLISFLLSSISMIRNERKFQHLLSSILTHLPFSVLEKCS